MHKVQTNFLGFSEVGVGGLDLHLVVHGVALPVAAALDDVVRVLGHGGQLVHRGRQLLNTVWYIPWQHCLNSCQRTFTKIVGGSEYREISLTTLTI